MFVALMFTPSLEVGETPISLCASDTRSLVRQLKLVTKLRPSRLEIALELEPKSGLV